MRSALTNLSFDFLSASDSAAHIAEEVSNAAWVAPIAIVSAVTSTWLIGFFILIAASFTILDVGAILGSDLPLPMAQIYYNLLGKQGMLIIWS
jgi:amino acid transporter